MVVTFVETYDKLSDMNAGETATSKDRESFFVCGYYYDEAQKQNVKVILDLNNLYDQYTERRNMSQPVKILKAGDKFICQR
jgi:hypothetical protein